MSAIPNVSTSSVQLGVSPGIVDQHRRAQIGGAVAEMAVEAANEDDLLARTTLAIRGTLFPDSCGVLLVDDVVEADRKGRAAARRALDARIA